MNHDKLFVTTLPADVRDTQLYERTAAFVRMFCRRAEWTAVIRFSRWYTSAEPLELFYWTPSAAVVENGAVQVDAFSDLSMTDLPPKAKTHTNVVYHLNGIWLAAVVRKRCAGVFSPEDALTFTNFTEADESKMHVYLTKNNLPVADGELCVADTTRDAATELPWLRISFTTCLSFWCRFCDFVEALCRNEDLSAASVQCRLRLTSDEQLELTIDGHPSMLRMLCVCRSVDVVRAPRRS